MSLTVPSLLPAGLYDLLPPHATHERFVSGRLAEAFERFGYQQVSPPLMEFEASLLAGDAAKALASQTFRVMDPKSQDMLGFRPDITLQVGRIAATRLADWPRPLRLAYSGSTLRVKGEGKEGARQWRQAGIECIGADSPEADAEVIAIAAQAVSQLGVKELVLDINLPGMVQLLLDASSVPLAQQAAVLHAVECKDTGSVEAAKLKGYAALLPQLIDAAGEAKHALQVLSQANLPAAAQEQITYVQAVIAQLEVLGVPVELTIDPVENRGFEYHSLISYTLFSRSEQSELGRGGRYTISRESQEETATGMTLYINTLMQAVPLQSQPDRILVPGNVTLAACQQLQESGFSVLRSLQGEATIAQAKAQGCSHIWQQEKAVIINS